MLDIAKIKRNVKRMVDGGASEQEIDGYLGNEGLSAEQLRTPALPHPTQAAPDPSPPMFPARTGAMPPDLRVRRGFEDVGLPEPGQVPSALDSHLASQAAIQQGTSPIVGDRRPLGEAANADFGTGYYDDAGAFRATDAGTNTVLPDPRTGREMVYPRTPETEEGGAMGLARMVLGGLAAGAPTRIAGGAGVKELSRAGQVVGAFDRSGVDPSLVTALQSRATGYAANMLRNTPVGGSIQKSVVRGTEQAGQRADSLAGTLSDVGDAATAGTRVRSGAAEFTGTAVPAQQAQLYGQAEALINRGKYPAQASMDNARAVIGTIEREVNNPAVRELLTDKNYQKVADTIKSVDGITFADLRQLRTAVRKLKPSQESQVGLNRTHLTRIYDGLTADMNAMALRDGGPTAVAALKQADLYTRDVMTGPVAVLTELTESKSDEQIFGTLMRWAGKSSGADANKLMQVRAALPKEDWDAFSATVLRSMGEATPGARITADATQFSPATFLTNYEKMSGTGKTLLFAGQDRGELRKALDDLLVVTGEMKRVGQLGNPSGSSAHAITVGAATSLWYAPLTTLSMLGTGYGASRILTSPSAVRWLTGATRLAKNKAGDNAWRAHTRSISLIAANDNEMASALSQAAEQMRQATRAEQDERRRVAVGR